jgi:tRNA threonylcarbamoyladenosine biosynthesis protein TsaE
MMKLTTLEEVNVLAQRFAKVVQPGLLIFLHGDLGVGKTTFVRALLGAMGYEGHVKSPTYTLIESYHVSDIVVHHLDLYRLRDPEELLYIGIEDYLSASLTLIEWPDHGKGVLPAADIDFRYSYDADYQARALSIVGLSLHGKKCVEALDAL